MESQGFSQTPRDIMEEYNGCSVPQYTAYGCGCIRIQPPPLYTDSFPNYEENTQYTSKH